ncbi:epimerase [Corticibacter populi]|uniref:Epimerase n=1 Tax=Corticibacter populi TaxID=1550736 RepID=A0A3M6QZZ5_9BURK|nr:DoxX-like family protein [Corticibacter populi]RMX08587.1 epimerase [Corticibacter populi]RZS35911.1 DoxX-like protein [Corticibacter populi]
MPISSGERGLYRSVAVVWLGTALVSALNWRGAGQALLAEGGVQAPHWQLTLMTAGTLWDLVIGVWLWLAPGRRSFCWALAGMLAMTLLASLWLPGLWLDPLGPLLKNLPITAILWYGIQTGRGAEPPQSEHR